VVFSRGGRTYRYPIANLSEEDQQYVREKAEEFERRGVLAKELRGQLVLMDRGTMRNLTDQEISGKRLFAFYYSASWCGPCRQFTPDLVSFYDEIKASHPEFELVFVSSDRDANSMRQYMREDNMTFPAVKYELKDNLAVVRRHQESGIPNLVFVDGSGEIISRSFVDGNYVGPRKVMSDIRSHLAGE
jgi:nucleoredoxin